MSICVNRIVNLLEGEYWGEALCVWEGNQKLRCRPVKFEMPWKQRIEMAHRQLVKLFQT